MKKLFTIIAGLFLTAFVFAQNGPITNVKPDICFCCGDFYNLPTPVITGPVSPATGHNSVDCGDYPQFTIPKCPTATVAWTVYPLIAYTTVTTATTTGIRLTPPLLAPSYTVTVKVTCGNKTVQSNQTVLVTSVTNCTALFSLQINPLASGLYQVCATPVTTAGVQHYWGLLGTTNPPPVCTAIPLATITSGGTFGSVITNGGLFTTIGMGTGIGTACTSGGGSYGYSYSGIGGAAGCYKLTHYVNCCGVWYRQTYCFCITPNTAGTGKSRSPELTKTEVEIVNENEIPRQLKSGSESRQ